MIKSIVAGAAFALATSFGTASADDAPFTALRGIFATPMTQGEMAVVVGQYVQPTRNSSPEGTIAVVIPDAGAAGTTRSFGNIVSRTPDGTANGNLEGGGPTY